MKTTILTAVAAMVVAFGFNAGTADAQSVTTSSSWSSSTSSVRSSSWSTGPNGTQYSNFQRNDRNFQAQNQRTLVTPGGTVRQERSNLNIDSFRERGYNGGVSNGQSYGNGFRNQGRNVQQGGSVNIYRPYR